MCAQSHSSLQYAIALSGYSSENNLDSCLDFRILILKFVSLLIDWCWHLHFGSFLLNFSLSKDWECWAHLSRSAHSSWIYAWSILSSKLCWSTLLFTVSPLLSKFQKICRSASTHSPHLNRIFYAEILVL